MFQLVYCVGGSLENLCHFEMGGGGGCVANADFIKGVAQCSQLLTGGRGVKFAKILLTSYVNAPLWVIQSLAYRFKNKTPLLSSILMGCTIAETAHITHSNQGAGKRPAAQEKK